MPITAGDEAPGPGPAGGDEVRRVPASRPKNPCSKRREGERTARALRAGVNARGWGRGGMREGMEGLRKFWVRRVSNEQTCNLHFGRMVIYARLVASNGSVICSMEDQRLDVIPSISTAIASETKIHR